MKSDIIVIGAGASGLMAAYSAAKTLVESGSDASVALLEKMPRAARKIMITGKGRCNFTNLKDWNEFSLHIRSNPNFVKSAFYALTPSDLIKFFEKYGMPSVVERGDRVFPSSHHSSDVVDTLLAACHGYGVKTVFEAEVSTISNSDGVFRITMADGTEWICKKLVICTGGLSYPSTGSTGQGYEWVKGFGHSVTSLFPSLTALVPVGYKHTESKDLHIHRETHLTELGEKLCGIQLKNVGVKLLLNGNEVQSEFGDVDFTDGGIEGPVGFQLSRKSVKAMINGSKVSIVLDLKEGVSLTELTQRVKTLWEEIDKDPRSRNLREKEKCRILLGKLMPWDLIPAFVSCHPEILTLERKSRTKTKVWINLLSIAKALKNWKFDIAGYVGYERAVVTAGGVDTDEFISKTMESRIVNGLYVSGELFDVDADTGGYNLQLAFSTGSLAGQNAAKALVSKKS